MISTNSTWLVLSVQKTITIPVDFRISKRFQEAYYQIKKDKINMRIQIKRGKEQENNQVSRVGSAHHKYLLSSGLLHSSFLIAKTNKKHTNMVHRSTTMLSPVDFSLALLQIKQFYFLLSITLTRIMVTQRRNTNFHISFSTNYFDRWQSIWGRV